MKILIKQKWKRFQANYEGHLYVTVIKKNKNDCCSGARHPTYKPLPDTWEEDYASWQRGEVTGVALYHKYGISKATFGARVREYRAGKQVCRVNVKTEPKYALWVYVYETMSDRIPKSNPIKKFKCGEREEKCFYYDECMGSIVYAVHKMNGLPIPDIDYGFYECVWDSSLIDGKVNN